MIILTDTREQYPYTFERWSVEIQPAGLPAGDYSIPGFDDKVSVERKSIDDLVSCLMGKTGVDSKRNWPGEGTIFLLNDLGKKGWRWEDQVQAVRTDGIQNQRQKAKNG